MGGLTRELQVFEDPWIGRCRTALFVVGGLFLLLGLVNGPLATLSVWTDPDTSVVAATVITLVASAMAFCLWGLFAAVNFAAAAGLKRGARWGWFLTVGLGLLYLMSCCLPFGVVLLIGTLNENTRTRFRELGD